MYQLRIVILYQSGGILSGLCMAKDDPDFKVKWYEDKNGNAVIEHKRDGGKYLQQVTLTKTPCNYGNTRFWYYCPHCYRRVGRLYLPTNLYCNGVRVQVWKCRSCYNLTYEQRRKRNLANVYSRRAEIIANKLKIKKIKGKEYFYRPKYMRQKTFDYLVDRHGYFMEQSNLSDWRFMYKIFKMSKFLK